MLDVEVIAGIAPGCKIIVVFAPNTNAGFIDGLNKCLELDPDAVSISWGAGIDQWDASSIAGMDAAMKALAEKGIPCFVASGDNGSNDGNSQPTVDYPAASPWAIATGGTTLILNSDGSVASETAWSLASDGSGSGGGVATSYPTPDWQSGLLPNLPTGRRSPDVSSVANPDTGWSCVMGGMTQVVGGTSSAAPLWAAIHLILNEVKGHHVGNLHTKFYSNPGCFNLITVGTNGAYSCTDGYSCVTGLGSPNTQKLIEVL